MAWTSVSLMSTSAWNGPSGSAIISPSKWQTQVLDNLCVLALHNHSGSAGEGATLTASAQAGMDVDRFFPFLPVASLGTWTIVREGASVANPYFGDFYMSTCGASNASIVYDVYTRQGTYRVGLTCLRSSSTANISIHLDNIFVGSAIVYAGGAGSNFDTSYFNVSLFQSACSLIISACGYSSSST